MSRASIFDHIIKKAYTERAFEQIASYEKLVDLKPLTHKERSNAIDKVYTMTAKLLLITDGRCAVESINQIVEKTLSKLFEIHNLELKLFHLLLLLLEQHKGIKCGPLPSLHQIKQEQPTVTPDLLLNSRLHATLYEHLESESYCKQYLIQPDKALGYLYMWLILKEGVRRSADIKALIESKDSVYRIEQHWFYEVKERRYWLSPKAELLLGAWYSCSQSRGHGNVMKTINNYLRQHRIMTSHETIKLGVLKDALKVEHTLKYGAIDYGLSAYSHKTTKLKPETLARIITAAPVYVPLVRNLEENNSSIRQQRAWQSAFAQSSPSLRVRPKRPIKQYTVQTQLKIVKRFTAQMDKLGINERKIRTTQIRTQLRQQLEDKEKAKGYPWCWLILAWMYKLLDKGGKIKSRLNLNTIKSYINYVAEPFLNEFSGSDPGQLTPLDWAEKLNIAAEQIQSATKKGYIVYFAEFLIDSHLAKDLCLSDLDIPIVNAQVSSNLLTIDEVNSVIEECGQYDAHIGPLAQVILSLGFFAGLRRGEIAGLQYKDFTYNEDLSYVNLHIRPNKYRELKSKDGSRNLPLDSLLPYEKLKKLIHYIESHNTKFSKQSSLIFSDSNQLNRSFNLVTDIMQNVVGDPTLRFHHCRHSFCNWTWVRLHRKVDDNWNQFLFLRNEYFSFECCAQLTHRLALESHSRKKAWALATLLGHSSPTTTISSYLHVADWLRRIRFSNHTPTASELRIIWGQRIQLDADSRVVITPKLEATQHALLPARREFEVYVRTLEETPTAARAKTNQTRIISLTMLWRIMRRLAEGLSEQEVAEGLKVSPEVVHKIQLLDQEAVETSLTRSKYRLEPMLNYNRLNRGNVKAIEILIRLFEDNKNSAEFKALNLGHITNILQALVGAKNSLIRTHDEKAVLTLIRLLKLMGLPKDRLRVKWYFPNLNDYNNDRPENYRKHYEYWLYALQQRCGYKDVEVECIVPQSCAHLVRQEHLGITISDDGRFLSYKGHGYVSIHVLQKKFKSQRTTENGEPIHIAQRTRAFISFVRLLVIYQQIATC